MCYIFIWAYLCRCGSYGFYGSNNCTLRFRKGNTSGHALSHARKELKIIMLNSKVVIIFSHGFPFGNARFFSTFGFGRQCILHPWVVTGNGDPVSTMAQKVNKTPIPIFVVSSIWWQQDVNHARTWTTSVNSPSALEKWNYQWQILLVTLIINW